MNLFDYVDKYKDYTFLDKSFNEVDNVILSCLSYVNFSYIIPQNKKNKVTLKEAADRYFMSHSKKAEKIDMLAHKEALKILRSVKDTIRFKDIYVYGYEYIFDAASQFSAITFEINKDLCYVAFEGTDQLVSGWKEDCEMAYRFPVRAHKYAIKYLNHNFLFSDKKLIVGGHSKGGNLALVSSMYCNFLIRRKIINVYSNDGQGLRKAQIESKHYQKIQNKLIHIIPQFSVVGLLLRHDENYIVIHSTRPGFAAHCTSYWKVEDDHFKRDKLSPFSEILDKGLITWLDKYDDEKREKFVESTFKILEENNVKSVLQFRSEIKLIFKILRSAKNLDPIVNEMLKDLIKIITDTNKEYNWIK